MLRWFPITAAIALSACPKPTPTEPAADAVVPHDPAVARDYPEPLPERPLVVPTLETRTLSNGLKVMVVPNNEVPIVNVTVAFNVGGFADEVPGEARATFDMLNEGAGDLNAAQIAKKLQTMASTLSTSGGADGGAVSISSLTKNLGETLDLLALVIEEPSFPEGDWELMQSRYVAGVESSRKDPVAISRRVQNRLLFGDQYRGRLPSEEHYQAIDTAKMKAWWAKYGGPENAVVLVGGATDADTVTELLEARLGDWKPEGIESPKAEVTTTPPEASTLYFVDKPGAAQSVVRAYNYVGTRTDADWFAYDLAIDVLGGSFMSRLNLNLREDKAYTYGARCGTILGYGTGIVSCGASVKTDVTGPSLTEMRKELDMIRGDKPITADELAYMQGASVNGYPKRFETPSALLGEQVTIWRYDLPVDWPSTYLDNIKSVSLEQAQAALASRWNSDQEIWLVVGDKAVIGEDVKAFGLPIVEIDANGDVVGE